MSNSNENKSLYCKDITEFTRVGKGPWKIHENIKFIERVILYKNVSSLLMYPQLWPNIGMIYLNEWIIHYLRN